MTTPKRGIGHTTLAALGAFAGARKISLFEALFHDSLEAAVSSRAVHGLHEFGRTVHDLQARANAAVGKDAAMKLCLDWLKELDYEAHLQHVEEAGAATRYSNVLDFVEWVARRCGGRDEDDPSSRCSTWRKASASS